jgi:hypothetical protein
MLLRMLSMAYADLTRCVRYGQPMHQTRNASHIKGCLHQEAA